MPTLLTNHNCQACDPPLPVLKYEPGNIRCLMGNAELSGIYECEMKSTNHSWIKPESQPVL